jgi:hypothetical protein
MQMFMACSLHFAIIGCDQSQLEKLMLIAGRTPYLPLQCSLHMAGKPKV